MTTPFDVVESLIFAFVVNRVFSSFNLASFCGIVLQGTFRAQITETFHVRLKTKHTRKFEK